MFFVTNIIFVAKNTSLATNLSVTKLMLSLEVLFSDAKYFLVAKELKYMFSATNNKLVAKKIPLRQNYLKILKKKKMIYKKYYYLNINIETLFQ